MADTAPRISPDEARRHRWADPTVLLVCAYDSDEKCRNNWIDGAITLNDFRAREAGLPKDREIIFYCA
jgi:rhodanese-related sulfurtransferase